MAGNNLIIHGQIYYYLNLSPAKPILQFAEALSPLSWCSETKEGTKWDEGQKMPEGLG